MKKYPYKDAKLRPEDHAILRTLSYVLNEPYARVLGRLIRQEAKQRGLEDYMTDIFDELPSVSFSERSALPEIPAVYYVADDQAIVYIGASMNLRDRWLTHTKAALMGDGHRIYWREAPAEGLWLAEEQEIERYVPPWNGKTLEEEAYRSIKIPFSAWQALTRLCAATGEPRTRELAKIIHEAERQQTASQQREDKE